MTTEDITSVTDQLAKTSVESQRELSYAGRGFKLDKAEDAQEIIDDILVCDGLTTLQLEGNTLGVEAAKVIGIALEKHATFERALWSDMFTGRLKSEIPEALKYLGDGIMKAGAKLVELNLSDNAFGPNGMKGLTTLLTSESCYSLKVLRLHNNGLGTTGGKMLAECLLECHKRSVAAGSPLALQVFQSGRGRLENEGAKALAQAFKAMGSLEEVVMPQNGIYHEGITALADAFKVNKKLKIINLQDNTFTEKGAESMAQALPYLENLETLHFGDCLLKTPGALILADGLKGDHPKLREVNVTFNEIGVDGAHAIAEVLADKEALERLELGGNCLGESGIELVQGTLEAVGKMDLLGSFSEDEGTEDEGDDDDEEEEEEEEDGDEGEGQEVDDLQITGVAITPRGDAQSVSAATLLAFPSPAKLEQMGPKRVSAILEHLGNDINDVAKAVNVAMRLCSVIENEDNQTKVSACECADAILGHVFKPEDKGRAALVSNEILMSLGLIKSEDKKFQPLGKINGALIALTHIVQQPYFPKMAKDIVTVFLSRGHQRLLECPKSLHSLMTVLQN